MKRPLMAMVLALALPAAAQAGDYSYIEIGYATTETRLLDYYSGIDAYEGFSIRGSWGFAENWFATAEYRQGDGDFGLELDNQWSLGLGYHRAINDKADWYLLGLYGQEEENIFNLESKNTSLEIGVRGGSGNWYGLAAAGFEDLNSNANVLDETQAFLRVGGGYRFNDTWSLGLEYKHGFDGASAGFFGPRISF